MAAQFTFNERPAFPTAAIMNRARDEFLAGARLSQQEYSRIGWCHHLNLPQNLA